MKCFELRLWVDPFFPGRGSVDDLLVRACGDVQLGLADTRRLSNGVVILSYRIT